MSKEIMQNTEYQKLKEASWRRPLTAAERARLREWLSAHPEALESWEEEAALNGLLRRWPGAAVSTNFTARVLQAAQRLPAKPAWRRRLEMFPWLPAGWVPRAALAAAMVCSGLLSFHEYEALRRTREAQAVASVSRLAALPSIDWLENFDTINRLNKVKVADDDLLTVLQ
jgi:anti-sigma factor RsiW